MYAHTNQPFLTADPKLFRNFRRRWRLWRLMSCVRRRRSLSLSLSLSRTLSTYSIAFASCALFINARAPDKLISPAAHHTRVCVCVCACAALRCVSTASPSARVAAILPGTASASTSQHEAHTSHPQTAHRTPPTQHHRYGGGGPHCKVAPNMRARESIML